jgi:Cytochrome P450
MHNGPGYWSEGFEIPDSVRSETARSNKGRQVGSWDPKDLQKFKPERWLVKDEAGNEEYDAMAGPQLLFGLGPRGCFGKRLAYLEERLMLVMIFWTFELKKCPDELSGYTASDKLTRKPHQVFVKLEKARW